ncbi:desiccation protectant protein Lea14 homolog isoform X1 [Neltuma alba]|uniref:desiccation protectant protein Lea14 homolog isoform X1 n=1 Tax=Neltuma alba TaxID=207710 RepID=UPI0010A37F14|nr:desiccation protectant protein Lea14 homolog isoform X1 [Prosopis alba]
MKGGWRLRTKVTAAVISVSVIIGLWKLSQAVKTYVAKKIADVPMPEASVDDVDFKSVSREGVEYLAKVSVSNPYPTPLPICEISYSLKSDGREIATGVIPDPGSLKAKASTMVEVPVKVAHSILLSLGRDVAKDWDIDYKLDLVFIIDLPVIGNIKIPVSQQGEIKLPTLSDWFA